LAAGGRESGLVAAEAPPCSAHEPCHLAQHRVRHFGSTCSKPTAGIYRGPVLLPRARASPGSTRAQPLSYPPVLPPCRPRWSSPPCEHPLSSLPPPRQGPPQELSQASDLADHKRHASRRRHRRRPTTTPSLTARDACTLNPCMRRSLRNCRRVAPLHVRRRLPAAGGTRRRHRRCWRREVHSARAPAGSGSAA